MAIHLKSSQIQNCLVLGGAGFLGRHLVEDLLATGYKVSVFDLRQGTYDDRISFFQGDICSFSDLSKALQECDTVFHLVSPLPVLGNRDMFYRINVTGTNTLVAACRETGVSRLVLTSSTIVVYNGFDVKYGNENMPYSIKPMDYYTETKALQEQIVLNANSEYLMTCAIRPQGIFGPGDPTFIPNVVEAARTGKTKYKIGDGSNLFDFTYVGNVTHGLILAAQSLQTGSVSCGSVYNITNDSPMLFWDFISRILTEFDYPAPVRSHPLPYWFIYFIACITQLFCYIISPLKKVEPTFTPLVVTVACTHQYHSCYKAKSELGYTPKYSLEEAIRKSIDAFQHLRRK